MLMQLALSILHREFLQWGLHINALKTGVMSNAAAIRSCNPQPDFHLGAQRLKTVQHFKYLGSTVTPANSLDAGPGNSTESAADAI